MRNAECPSQVSVVAMAANLTVQDRPTRRRTFHLMGSRLLPLSLALGAALADAGGVHRLGFWLLLLAVPAAAAAAFVGVGDVLEGKSAWIGSVKSSFRKRSVAWFTAALLVAFLIALTSWSRRASARTTFGLHFTVLWPPPPQPASASTHSASPTPRNTTPVYLER